jgi:hypothetical protein
MILKQISKGNCIVVIIFANMVVMGIEHYKQSEMVEDILKIMNIVFTTIFTLEAAIKITGLRFHYFREQELPTLPEHLSSHPAFGGVHVARSLVLCVCFVEESHPQKYE